MRAAEFLQIYNPRRKTGEKTSQHNKKTDHLKT